MNFVLFWWLVAFEPGLPPAPQVQPIDGFGSFESCQQAADVLMDAWKDKGFSVRYICEPEHIS